MRRQLIAIMFTDIVGFSKLTQENEALALELLEKHWTLLRPVFSGFDGIEIKTIGDGILIEFSSALQAVRAGLAIQEELDKYNRTVAQDHQIRLRIGIHLGDVERRGEDVFGDGVNIASRLEPLAEPGGICISESVYVSVHNKLDCPLYPMGEQQLKNISQPIATFSNRPGQSVTRAKLPKRVFLAATAAALLIILFISIDRGWIESVMSPREAATPEASSGQLDEAQHSIAVLPFVNMSSDPEQEYFSDGITEEVINLLAKIPELRVIARTSSFYFKDKEMRVGEIGEALNVRYVLEGSVRREGDRVRITAQLIETRSDAHLWSETYERTLESIFAIQVEVASEVVAQLKVTLLGAAPVIEETDPEAFALYLQGRHLARQRTAAGYEQALALLQQALVLDPGYAAAWTELGSVYIGQVNLGLRPNDEGYMLAREAVNKALAIDPHYALAHARLGQIARAHDDDLAAAARHLQRALQLEPANTDIISGAARLAESLGRLNEASALIEFVVARDPVNPDAHAILGRNYSYAGRWDESIVSYRTALTLSPGYSVAQYAIGTALLLKGETQAALEAIQQEDSVWRMIGLPLAYHALGQADESDTALAELIEQYGQLAPFNVAYILAWRGEADRAFEWLDKAVEYKDGVSHIINQPLFANIHDDPRWLPFLESIGNSPEQLAAIEFKVMLPE